MSEVSPCSMQPFTAGNAARSIIIKFWACTVCLSPVVFPSLVWAWYPIPSAVVDCFMVKNCARFTPTDPPPHRKKKTKSGGPETCESCERLKILDVRQPWTPFSISSAQLQIYSGHCKLTSRWFNLQLHRYQLLRAIYFVCPLLPSMTAYLAMNLKALVI